MYIVYIIYINKWYFLNNIISSLFLLHCLFVTPIIPSSPNQLPVPRVLLTLNRNFMFVTSIELLIKIAIKYIAINVHNKIHKKFT